MTKWQNDQIHSMMLVEGDIIRLNDALYEKKARQTDRFLLGQWVICEMEIKQVIEMTMKGKIIGVRDAQASGFCRNGYKVFALSNSNLCWSMAIQKLYHKASKALLDKQSSDSFIPLYDYFIKQHDRCLSYKSDEKRGEVCKEINDMIEKVKNSSISIIRKNLFK